MSKFEFTGEESNYLVLEKTLEALEEGCDRWVMIQTLRKFLKGKEHIATELDELTIRARGGDKQAARDLIVKLAEMNDGP